MQQTLYRIWRPKKFDEVIGQKDIIRVLTNEIKMDRISHAYLFCGPRGTGKTSCARIVARSLNCIEGPTVNPCGVCSSCVSIDKGASLDVIEIDAASNRGVDNIRELREKVHLTPVECKYKIYIIDEVHMLTGEAFNALLKTLEEPPSHTIFIMATTESHKLPKTIISRCQRFDFHRISSKDIAQKLQMEAEKEQIHIHPNAITRIAESCDGAMRDAESILDQLSVLSNQEEEIVEQDVLSLLGKSNTDTLYEIMQNIFHNDFSSLLTSLEELSSSGTDFLLFSQDLLSYCRDLIVLAETSGKSSFLSVIPKQNNDKFYDQAKQTPVSLIVKFSSMLANTLPNMKFLSRPSLLLETCILEMKHLVQHPPQKNIGVPSTIEKKTAVPTQPSVKKSNPVKTSNTKIKKEPQQEKIENKKSHITFEKPPEIKDPLWKEFIPKLKEKSPDLFIHVMRTQLVKVHENIAYVVFSHDNKFSFEQLSKKKNTAELNEIFHTEYPDIAFKLVPNLGYNPEKANHELALEKEKEKIQKDPVIIEALKIFQTSVDKIEKNK